MFLPILLIATALIDYRSYCGTYVQVSNPRVRVVEHDTTLDLIVNGRKRVLDQVIMKPFGQLTSIATRQRKGITIEEHYYAPMAGDMLFFDSILFKPVCHEKSQ